MTILLHMIIVIVCSHPFLVSDMIWELITARAVALESLTLQQFGTISWFFFSPSKKQSIQWHELDEIRRGNIIKGILYAEEELERAAILYSKSTVDPLSLLLHVILCVVNNEWGNKKWQCKELIAAKVWILKMYTNVC